MSQTNVSSFRIRVDGQEISPTIAALVSEVKVQDSLTLPDVCVLTVNFFEKAFTADDDVFKIGASIDVGFQPSMDKSPERTIFHGEILTLEPKFSGEAGALSVRSYDRGHRLTHGRHVRSFVDVTVADVVKKLVGEAGLGGSKVNRTTEVLKFIQQDNETNWDFIWKLAHMIGYEFYVDDKDAHFAPIDSEGKPAKELQWGVDLLAFEPRVTMVGQVGEVSVRSWDPKARQEIVGRATSATKANRIGLTTPGRREPSGAVAIVTRPVPSQQMAEAVAHATLERLVNGSIQAEGQCIGDPTVKAGAIVKISQLGTRFSGSYRVQSSSHMYRGGGTYTTDFSTTTLPTLTAAIGAATPVTIGTQLTVGIVTNTDDPDKLGRVRVKLPVLGPDHEAWWARVVTPMASEGAGINMRPQVGDEVLIGFEHGDTTRPYVIGSLWNGVTVPPEHAKHSDGTFGLEAREPVHVRSQRSVEIEALGGGARAGSERSGADDPVYRLHVGWENGKAVETFDGTLETEVKKDHTLKVTGKLVIEAGEIEMKSKTGAINVTSASDLTLQTSVGTTTVKGLNVHIEASAQLGAKGTEVGIQGSARVAISGAVVQIG